MGCKVIELGITVKERADDTLIEDNIELVERASIVFRVDGFINVGTVNPIASTVIKCPPTVMVRDGTRPPSTVEFGSMVGLPPTKSVPPRPREIGVPSMIAPGPPTVIAICPTEDALP